jgi:mono/diheme cytochrome c family protein
MNRSAIWAIAFSAAAFAVPVTARNHAGRDTRFSIAASNLFLRTHCLGCHNDKLKDGGISFTDRDGLIHGGAHGPAIVPGNPDASILIQAVRQDGALTMPPGGKLSPKDIATLTQWIKRGAAWGTKLRANDSPKSPICHLSGNKTERRADYRICAGL